MHLKDDGQISADLPATETWVNGRCSRNTQWNSDTESDGFSVPVCVGPGDDSHSSTELVSQQGLMDIDIKLEPSPEIGDYAVSSSACEYAESPSACEYDASSSVGDNSYSGLMSQQVQWRFYLHFRTTCPKYYQ